MQPQEQVRFLKNHQGSVRGVAFHPKVGVYCLKQIKLKLL